MKIALLGYGRMGKTIEKFAQERNHEIVFILDKNEVEIICLIYFESYN